MKFKNWLLTEEIWQNNTATVYHRTDSQNIKNILSTGWKVGSGDMYGSGLYTTFAIESQFTDHMERYGTSLIKFKVTNLDQYLICQKSVAQQVLGQNYKISDQLKKLNLTDLYTPEQIEKFDQMMETEKFSSAVAKKMYDTNNNLDKKAKGIIYYDFSNGYCLVKYPPIEDSTITLLAFANDAFTNDMQKMQELQTNCKKNQEGKCENPWITSTSKLAIKHLYSLPEKDREKAAENTITNADDEAESILNQGKNIDLSIKKILQKKLPISASFKKKLLLKSENMKDILPRLFRNEDINKDFISSVLINSAVNKDKIFEALGQNNIDKVADKEYRNILDYIPREYQHDFVEALIKHKKHITKELLPHGNYGINNQYGFKNVIELIFKYKPKEFTPDLIGYLMNRGILAEEFLNKFSPEIIEKIPNKYIEQFFYKTSVKRMLKLFGPEKLKSLNKDSIVNIIKENIYWTDQIINFYGNYYLNYFTHADLGKLFWNLKTQQHAEDDDALDLVFSNIQRQLTMSDAMAIADEIQGGMPQVKKAAEKHGKTIMPDL